MSGNKVVILRKNLVNYFYKYGIYSYLILLILFFSLQTEQFTTLNNLINILQQAAALGIATSGMILVLLTAGIDISVGSVMYFASCLAGIVISRGMGLIPAILIALIGGGVIGALNGLAVAKFKIVPFIVTLATMSIARGLGLLVSRSKILFFFDVSKIISVSRFLGIPVVVYLLIVILITVNFLLRRTQFGKQLFAIGNDKSGAEKMGINVERKIFIAYFICGILAGLAGFISSAQVSAVTPAFAIGNEFVVISAAVLGGTSLFGGKGNILPGALMGVIIVTIIENGLNITNASPYAYPVVRGVVIFIAVMVDSLKNSGEHLR